MSTVIAHRLSALEDSNSEIKQQLELMLEIGRRNEEKFLWLKSFILKLLEVQGFAQLDQIVIPPTNRFHTRESCDQCS